MWETWGLSPGCVNRIYFIPPIGRDVVVVVVRRGSGLREKQPGKWRIYFSLVAARCVVFNPEYPSLPIAQLIILKSNHGKSQYPPFLYPFNPP
jgi:hypothetical protein